MALLKYAVVVEDAMNEGTLDARLRSLLGIVCIKLA
jgi:hypothetical protein